MSGDVRTLWDELESDVERSVRYHMSRESFLSMCHQWSVALLLLFSTSAFASLQVAVHSYTLSKVAACAAALLSTLDLIFRPSDIAKKHMEIRRSYSALWKDIELSDKDDLRSYKAFRGRYLSIEAEEPPVYHAVDLHCQNAMIRARFPAAEWKGRLHSMKRSQILLRHVWRFEGI